MISEKDIRTFVAPFYENRDVMHDLSHVDRVLKKAKQMAEVRQVDDFVLSTATYCHGIISVHKEAITAFLDLHHIDKEKQEAIIQTALDADKEALPTQMEGKILHDAHLLEGGETFGIIRPLVCGALSGKSLEESIDHYEQYLQGRFKCVLPENHEEFQRREAFAFLVIEKLIKEI